MGQESFRDIVRQIARRRSSEVAVLGDFCRMAACALAAGSREEEYHEAISSYDREELNLLARGLALLVEEMEESPFEDVLGPYYTEVASHSSRQARGEFYTPPAISDLMARISIDADLVRREGRPITISDPCCGSGGMILALARRFAPDSIDLIRATCQDINPLAVDMCYINTSLWGIPAHIIRGDTIRMTTSGAWRNVHWMRVGEDGRQMCTEMERIIASSRGAQEENAEKATAGPDARFGPDGQFEFVLEDAPERSR